MFRIKTIVGNERVFTCLVILEQPHLGWMTISSIEKDSVISHSLFEVAEKHLAACLKIRNLL